MGYFLSYPPRLFSACAQMRNSVGVFMVVEAEVDKHPTVNRAI